ncbi:MAG: DMT family transporter [Proteobacteria bacterium]|nr:DMT family transporter [Pseudomonadota bacterium]
MLLILSVLWGSTFFFWKVLVAALPPFTVVLGRVGLAALALNLFLISRGRRMPTSFPIWGAFIVMGLLNNVIPFSLIVWGEIGISSGLASILNATTPIFTVLAAHLMTANEKLTWSRGVGVLLGFLGVAVLIGRDALDGLGAADLPGELACLSAAVIYAFAGIYGRRFRTMDPIAVATGQVTGSTLVLLPLASLVDQPWSLPAPGIGIWAALVATALICTALAYILYFRILAAAGATNLLLVTLLLPVSALILGALFLDEPIETNAVAGMGLIALGLAAIDGRLLRWLGRSAGRSLGVPKAGD